MCFIWSHLRRSLKVIIKIRRLISARVHLDIIGKLDLLQSLVSDVLLYAAVTVILVLIRVDSAKVNIPAARSTQSRGARPIFGDLDNFFLGVKEELIDQIKVEAVFIDVLIIEENVLEGYPLIGTLYVASSLEVEQKLISKQGGFVPVIKKTAFLLADCAESILSSSGLLGGLWKLGRWLLANKGVLQVLIVLVHLTLIFLLYIILFNSLNLFVLLSNMDHTAYLSIGDELFDDFLRTLDPDSPRVHVREPNRLSLHYCLKRVWSELSRRDLLLYWNP